MRDITLILIYILMIVIMMNPIIKVFRNSAKSVMMIIAKNVMVKKYAQNVN